MHSSFAAGHVAAGDHCEWSSSGQSNYEEWRKLAFPPNHGASASGRDVKDNWGCDWRRRENTDPLFLGQMLREGFNSLCFEESLASSYISHILYFCRIKWVMVKVVKANTGLGENLVNSPFHTEELYFPLDVSVVVPGCLAWASFSIA